MGEQENPNPKIGEVALTPLQNPPAKSDAAVHRTPEVLMAKAIAPGKAEYLLPPSPTRPQSNGDGIDEDASERKGVAAAMGVVKVKKSKWQLKRERRQIPFYVVVGWIMGRPMDLNFQLFETATLFITVLVVAFMLQVVELLIRKLETEPSLHRRIDFFFLADSITQCSHGQKGIAGALYIPTVQAALPRLLGAAAPPGAGAQENRRQCVKVLRLWLERRILPESLLRRYMDDIVVPNDDMSAGILLRRPSLAEHFVDDPIREMEDMFVVEYRRGSS